MNRANRRSLSLNLSSARFRSLMSDETPMTASSTPRSSKTGVSVTRAGKVVPSRRRTVNSPDQPSPARMRPMISAARPADSGATTRSMMLRPVASSAVHPYSASAERFQ